MAGPHGVTGVWQTLATHADEIRTLHMRTLFEQDHGMKINIFVYMRRIEFENVLFGEKTKIILKNDFHIFLWNF
jgi:hypothetical protein